MRKRLMNGCGSGRRASAFTLIELLVVLGIIGVLAGLVLGARPGRRLGRTMHERVLSQVVNTSQLAANGRVAIALAQGSRKIFFEKI